MIARHKFAYPLDQVAGNIYIIYISLFKKKKCNILALRTTYPDVSTDDWLTTPHKTMCCVCFLSLSLPFHPIRLHHTQKKKKKEKKKAYTHVSNHLYLSNINGLFGKYT